MTTFHSGQTISLGHGRAYILSVHHTGTGDEIIATITTPTGARNINLRVDPTGTLVPITARTMREGVQ